MYTPFIDGFWYLIPWTFMGFGMAGIGLSVMHDGNHNAYSKNPLINKRCKSIHRLSFRVNCFYIALGIHFS